MQTSKPGPGIPGVQRNRLMGLDAARGAAMFLVCLAHFQNGYLQPLGIQRVTELLSPLTRAATPTFILISGFVLGFLYATNQKTFDRTRRNLVDRALFLLTVARVPIVFAHVPITGFRGALDIVFVTDTIAVCVLVGTVVVPAIGMRARAALGVLLYVGSVLVLLLWIPQEGSVERFLKHLLVGHRSHSVFVYSFPILPWLAVYLVATSVGERLARLRGASERTGFGGLIGLGSLLLASGVLLWSLRSELALLPAFADTSPRSALVFLTSTWQKLPPGPVYLLCYLGLALYLVTASLWLARARPDAALLKMFALLGRNSLIVFVAQYAVYYTVLYSLHLPYTQWWPLLFAASFLALVLFAAGWQRANGQRLLTVGYPGLVARAGRVIG
jgi:uncharacterized membrane protein